AFMAVLAALFDVLDSLTPAEKAAAALGVYTDTSALLHGATPLDFKMFEVLTRSEETQDILDELRDYRVPPEWNAYRAAAFRNQEVTGQVRVAPVGFVRDAHRDVIAEIATELLRTEKTSIALAIGVTNRGVEVSVRADSRLLGTDQERIVRVIDYLLEAAFPGVSGFPRARLCPPPERPCRGGAGLPPRPPPAAPRGRRRLRPAHEGAAPRVGPRQRRRPRRHERPGPPVLPGDGPPARRRPPRFGNPPARRDGRPAARSRNREALNVQISRQG